jgi:hypothetical protein
MYQKPEKKMNKHEEGAIREMMEMMDKRRKIIKEKEKEK